MSESTLKQSGENKGSLHSPVGDHQIHPNVLNEMVARHAIETIGMGLYQWQLLVSCAFGFVVDQVGQPHAWIRRFARPLY